MSKLKSLFGFRSKHEDENRKQSTMANVGTAASQTETINRFGSAVKEHFVSYDGINRETGQVLKKGLKSISENKISPSNRNSNIRSQAGFAAEVKTVARENAERIISGDSTRSIRTDDMAKQVTANGKSIGGVNDQLFDVASVDKNGVYIDGTGRQLKYVGSDPEKCLDKLLSGDYDKYRDANVPIEIKKDFYNDVQNELNNKIDSLNEQIQKLENQGKYGKAEDVRKQLDRAEKTKANLREGALTDKEAIEARLHPKLSTAKDIAKVSHRAGLEGAKSGAVIGGGMSCVKNIVSVIKGNESPEEAAANVIFDTGASAVSGYAINSMGSGLKGFMQNSSSNLLRQFSNSALPGAVAVGILEAGKTLYRFADGQINAEECFIELGEKGAGVTASTIGTVVGQVAIPIPIVGAAVGGMVGYALSSSYYNELVTLMQNRKLAHEERIRIEAECQEAIAEMKRYRAEIEQISETYFADYKNAFSTAFATIEESLISGDADGVIMGSNMITKKLGGTVQYNNMEEFDSFMNDLDSDFIL